MLLRCSLRTSLAISLMCLATACHADEAAPSAEAGALPELGLMGTIPLYWGEAGDFGELLAGGSETHWARARLEEHYRLRPLDTLDAASLAGLDYLMMAQPRALGPAENVALDAWVRAGGRLLLFADPMLTGESRFAIGDRRRPQDVILLSPILEHWGLALSFDEDQAAEPAQVAAGAVAIPVELPGALAVGEGGLDCTILGEGVVADCALGQGRALVVADAALLDLHAAPPGAAEALDGLAARIFATARESAGNDSDAPR